METYQIRCLNNDINIKRNEFTNSRNDVDYAFTPIIAQYDKRLKLLSFITTIAFCLLFINIIFVFLLVLNFLCIALSIILLVIFTKKRKKTNEEWKKKLIPCNKIKEDYKQTHI